MCVCVCVCVCVFVYISIYVCVLYIYVCISLYLYIYIYMYIEEGNGSTAMPHRLTKPFLAYTLAVYIVSLATPMLLVPMQKEQQKPQKEQQHIYI